MKNRIGCLFFFLFVFFFNSNSIAEAKLTKKPLYLWGNLGYGINNPLKNHLFINLKLQIKTKYIVSIGNEDIYGSVSDYYPNFGFSEQIYYTLLVGRVLKKSNYFLTYFVGPSYNHINQFELIPQSQSQMLYAEYIKRKNYNYVGLHLQTEIHYRITNFSALGLKTFLNINLEKPIVGLALSLALGKIY